MKSFSLCILALWLASPVFVAGTSTHAPAPGNGRDCGQVFSQFYEEPDWYERLLDPVLPTQAEESAFTDQVSQVYICLEEKVGPLSAEEAELRLLAEYFLIFLTGYGEGPGPSTLMKVSPAVSDNSALVKIREVAKVPPPPGFFYVRLYSSTVDMPDMVAQAFNNPGTAGVTILSRYIAVPVVNAPRWKSTGRLDAETLDILSHELVHAYVNSAIGVKSAVGLPVWYREGLAIYFSGGGKSYTYMGAGWSFSRVPPEDYQEYDQVFRYLEKKLGRAGLLDLSRQSILRVDPSLLYDSLGITDEQEFFKSVRGWTRERKRLENVLAILAIPVCVGIALLFAALRQPEYTCRYCQNGGRRKQFSTGFCPFCGTKVEID